MQLATNSQAKNRRPQNIDLDSLLGGESSQELDFQFKPLTEGLGFHNIEEKEINHLFKGSSPTHLKSKRKPTPSSLAPGMAARALSVRPSADHPLNLLGLSPELTSSSAAAAPAPLSLTATAVQSTKAPLAPLSVWQQVAWHSTDFMVVVCVMSLLLTALFAISGLTWTRESLSLIVADVWLISLLSALFTIFYVAYLLFSHFTPSGSLGKRVVTRSV